MTLKKTPKQLQMQKKTKNPEIQNDHNEAQSDPKQNGAETQND